MPTPLRKRRIKRNLKTVESGSLLIKAWVLQILVQLGGMKEFVDEQRIEYGDFAAVLGVSDLVNPLTPFNADEVRLALQHEHQLLPDPEEYECELSEPLKSNARLLQDLLGLSNLQRRVVEFTVILHTELIVEKAARAMGDLNRHQTFSALSEILAVNVAEIQAAFHSKSALCQSEFVELSSNHLSFLPFKLELLNDALAEQMRYDAMDRGDFMKSIARPAPCPTLERHHFNHCERGVSLLAGLLACALNNDRGVNVLLYGPPGTGKTQLTRVLAASLNLPLYEIATENASYVAMKGEARLRAYQACQSFLQHQNALICFDEAEDAFHDGAVLFGEKSTAQVRKGWINQMLEENQKPTFWISNAIDSMDPAFIRRFDLVLEIPIPPRKQRLKLIKELAASQLSLATIDRLADARYLAPAVLDRAMSVCTRSGAAMESELTYVISNTLEAQGHARLDEAEGNALPTYYDPQYLNVGADLNMIASQLGENGDARVLCYGPPGTGKSALAQWLSNTLERPLMIRTASDILGPYVGESEKNLARAFHEAQRDDAILLLDEIDGVLSSREQASRNWEVTLVNELLTRLERHSGIVIATTNRFDHLDPAAMRRFDLKLEFQYLTAKQASALFQSSCGSLGMPDPEDDLLERITELGNLTPGDFHTVIRQSRFNPLLTPAQLLQKLRQECDMKPVATRLMGFV